MLKFNKPNNEIIFPYDMGLLDVNDGPDLVRTVRSTGYSLDITPNIM